MTVDEAIVRVRKLSQKVQRGEVAREMANVACNAANATYSASGNIATVSVINSGDGSYIVRAEGFAIGFLEFGTGVHAGRTSDDYMNIPSGYDEPGSWSAEHARTWQDWIKKGKDPAKYPYNRVPLPGMSIGRKEAINSAVRIMNGVLND